MEVTQTKTDELIKELIRMDLSDYAHYVDVMEQRITALKAEAGRGRAEALRDAAKIAENVARLEASMERRDGYMAASDIEHRISMLRTTAASQPETEAEALTFENLNESTT